MGTFWGRLGQMGSAMELNTPLGLAAWSALAGVPVGIIALYFLKLRRRPVRVPSTLLWRRSLEDLHVNSLFQRLRRNLLLFLQLLAVALVMLALAGPRMKGSSSSGQRYVLMIDNSASMSATDVAPSRLARAKEEAKNVVKAMNADDLAMVISFSDTARVVSNYTGDRSVLTLRIDAIEPTQATTSLREGLQVAAGLANPSKQIGEGVVASSVVTPKLFIYTDGGFSDVEGFSLGNLEPEVVVIGPPPPPYSPPAEGTSGAPSDEKIKVRNPSDNVAIVALPVPPRRGQGRPLPALRPRAQLPPRGGRHRGAGLPPCGRQARGRRRAGQRDLTEDPPQTDQSFKFDMTDPALAPYEVRLTVKDALDADNRAFTVVGTTRKAQVLAISAGNRYLADTLKTPLVAERADVALMTPEEARAEAVVRDVKGGRYDLIIYDGVKPDAAPEANALYFGVFPPGPAYAKPKDVQQPVVLDWDIGHPIMQYIRDLSLVFIASAKVVDLPPGAKSLIESNKGSLAFMAPREGFTDAVVTFPLIDGTTPNTTWFRYISFPLFILNSIQAMGNVREGSSEQVSQPGRPVVLHAETINKEIAIDSADRPGVKVPRSPQGTFIYYNADKAGVYLARWEPGGRLPFAVNLFDFRESDLAPRGLVPQGVPESLKESYEIKIGFNPVTATQQLKVQKDMWWIFAVLVLGVLLLEWYVYNRRVYI